MQTEVVIKTHKTWCLGFPIYKLGIAVPRVHKVTVRINELIGVKSLEHCLLHNKSSINIIVMISLREMGQNTWYREKSTTMDLGMIYKAALRGTMSSYL